MRKIVTKRLAPVSLAFVLGLGMSAVGCKGKDGPDAPDGGNGQQQNGEGARGTNQHGLVLRDGVLLGRNRQRHCPGQWEGQC